jgi:hypothetical protein
MQREQLENRRAIAVAALLAAALAWPSVLCALTDTLRSPYERALLSAWCGAEPPRALEFLGHCPACWAGALALAGAAGLLAYAAQNKPASVRK